MWIDRAKEAKQQLHMSCRDISLATKGKLSERDVTRLLNGEYKKPFVDDVIALGAALNLSPQELLAETNSVVENAKSAEETSDLKAKTTEMKSKIEKLELEVRYLNEVIALKDTIIDLMKDKV